MSADLTWGLYALLALRPLSLVAYTVWALRSPNDAHAMSPGAQPTHA